MTVSANHLAHFMHSLPFEWNMLVDECLHYLDEHDDGTTLGGHKEKAKRFLMNYHIAKKTMILHRDDMGMIDGMIMFYRFKGDWKWKDIEDWRQDDPDGKTIVIVWMHARNNKATREMIKAWLNCNDDWKECEYQAFRKNRVTKYPQSILRRMTKTQLN